MTFRVRACVPIPPGERRGFDHADVFIDETERSTVYLAHTGANRVDLIDSVGAKYAGSLPGHPGVAGVLVDTEQGLAITSDRAAGSVTVYRTTDNSLVGRAAVGARPNGLAYDPGRRNVFAFNLGEPIGEDCSVSIVSIDEMRSVASIALPGRPRWALYDPHSDRVFANIREPAQVSVIDAGRLQLVGAFDVPAPGPHGLVLSGDTLFCAADGAELVALDRSDGRVLGRTDLPGEPDVIMRDAKRNRLFVAIGDPGVVVVIDERTLEVTETIATQAGAHTIAWDALTGTIWAFLPGDCRALALTDS